MNNVQSPQVASALARARVSGDWFVWIAGLSIANSIISTISPSTTWGFFFGLGITQIIDGFSQVAHAPIVGLIIDILIAGVWVFFGLQAKKAKSWAFIVGMVCYVIDALIMLPFGDYLGAAVHAYALFRIFPGLAASKDYAQIQAQMRQQGAIYGGAAQPGAWPPAPGSPAQPPQFGVAPAPTHQSNPAQPTAYPGYQSQQPPAQPIYPQAQNLDGTPAAEPAPNWSQPAPSQPLPSHWPPPAQPAQPAPASEPEG
jgi:hypothetical protein